jgi:hypothetical protein
MSAINHTQPFSRGTKALSYFIPESALGKEQEEITPALIGDFLEPNEVPGQKLSTLFFKYMAQDAWIVSTGAERSLFDLFLAPDDCQGVIIRDINPKVKAYIDCVTLLLRLAKDREEFVELTNFRLLHDMFSEDLALKQKEIRQKIESDPDMTDELKKYYSDNLVTLTKTYFLSPRKWRYDPRYKNVNYIIKSPRPFCKLQNYAKAGRIIATIGSINNLTFLPRHGIRVGVVDTSNICDYSLLDIQVEGNPLIIWTKCTEGYRTKYHSFTLQKLEPSERAAFQDLYSRIRTMFERQSAFSCDNPERGFIFRVKAYESYLASNSPEIPFPSFTKETLEVLKIVHEAHSKQS